MKRAPLLFPTACSCTLWSQGRVEDGERWLRSQPQGPLGRWPGLQGLLPELQPETACYSGSFGPRQVFRVSPVGCGPPVRLCFAGVGLAYPGKDCRSVHELASSYQGTQCPLDPPAGTLPHARRCTATGPTGCLPCLLRNGKHFSIKFPKLPKALKIPGFSNNLFGSNTWLHQMGSCLQPSFSHLG